MTYGIVDNMTASQKFKALSPLAAFAFLAALDHADSDRTMPLYTPAAMSEILAPGHAGIGENMLTITAEWIAIGIAQVAIVCGQSRLRLGGGDS